MTARRSRALFRAGLGRRACVSLKGSAVRLSEYAVGRDNNFTLLRFAAAMTVLFAHSVAVLGLPPDSEFFLQAGRLFARRNGPRHAVRDERLSRHREPGRAAGSDRLSLGADPQGLSGPVVMLVLTVFVLAPALTTPAASSAYLCVAVDVGIFPQMRDAHRRRALFAAGRVRQCAAQRRVQWLAVDDAGRSADVSLSRRDLCRACRCAGAQAEGDARCVLPLVGGCADRDRLERALDRKAPHNGANIRVFMFLYGSSLFVWREQCTDGSLGCSSGFSQRSSLASFDKTVFFVVYAACLAPLVLHLVYVPGGRIRAVQRLGRLFLRRLYLRFPRPADAGLSFPGHDRSA